jgi:hypothetical protein
MSGSNGISPADLLKNWEARAKGVYNETLQFVREGIHGLEVMAGKTVEVTKLRLANQQALHRIRILFTELGQRIYNLVLHQRSEYPLKVPADILNFVDQIKKLQASVEENINRLRHLTTISREEAKNKKSSPDYAVRKKIERLKKKTVKVVKKKKKTKGSK